jgi:hypothetical protein
MSKVEPLEQEVREADTRRSCSSSSYELRTARTLIARRIVPHVNLTLLSTRALLLSAVIALPALCPSELHAADRLTAGLYEGTAIVNGKDQPFSHCFTPDEAKNVNADAKAGRQYAEEAGKGACKVTDYDITGARISMTVVCGKSVTTSVGTYHGDAFESDATRKVGDSVLVIHTKAKRVGACK